MDFKVKSPAVARRLRGFGGFAYLVDATTPDERVIHNARHFKSKGLDFDALCREGRISIWMLKDKSNRELRAIFSREVRRQERMRAATEATESLIPTIDPDMVPY